MSLWRNLTGQTLRDPVEGTFSVTDTTVTVDNDGARHVRYSGVLSGDGIPAAAVQVSRTFRPGVDSPSEGDKLLATIDRARPSRYVIAWPAQEDRAIKAIRDKMHAEQVAAAVRLGLAPSMVPAQTGPAPSFRDLANEELERRYGRHPLPDGNRPVTLAEAEQLRVTGQRATATITGIDYLSVPAKALPNPEATLANVALRVRRPDGTEYATTARFGFRSAVRRTQIGFAGAQVPVRIDPNDPARVCLDAAALPPDS
ncbi:hypothetical protein GCM10023322_71270 [Rugosimonospora acidiphila]|uniref:DUF3592 domain-containing protein n=2 Tax=Rugosimonospora acidiphila TaxID=556531 RepID=A0ABP9SNJ0_9ACTN